MQFDDAQLKTLAIVPKVSSVLSILGSSYIIWQVLSNENRRGRLHHRLLLGMSISDIIQSLAYFVSTWPMPAAVSPFPYSVGTVETCTAQGFFIQMGHAPLVYGAFLSICYYSSIKNNFSENLRLKKLEPFMHAFSVLWPSLGGFIAAADGAINIAGPVGCWINSVPPGCVGDQCIKGANSRIYRYIFAFATTIASLSVGTIAWIMLYCNVRKQNTDPNTSGAGGRRPSVAQLRTQKALFTVVSRQALLYLSASYFVWAIPLSLRWYQTQSGKIVFWMVLFFAIIMPMQGVINVIVYMRPTSKKNVVTAKSQAIDDGLEDGDNFQDEMPSSRRSSSVGAEDFIDSVVDMYELRRQRLSQMDTIEEMED